MIRIRDSLISIVGVVTAQALLFLCIVLMGRERGPEILGQFNYLVAIGTLTGTLLALRYELACVSDDPETSYHSMIHVLLLGAGMALIAAVFLWFFDLSQFFLVELYAIAVFVTNLAGAYLNSLRRYELIALARIAVNSGFAIFLVSKISNWREIDPFFAYTVISTLIGLLVLVCTVVHGRREGYKTRFELAFYTKNRRFVAYIFPATIFGSVMTYALAIAVPAWYGAKEAGYFAAAYRLGSSPVSLIGQSIGGVFRRDALGAVDRSSSGNRLYSVYRLYARSLVAVSLTYSIFGLVLFKPVTTIFLGHQWDGAHKFFYFLIPLFAMQILYVPLSQVFLAVRKQKLDFLFQLSSGSVLITTLYAMHMLDFSAQGSVGIFSITGAIVTTFGVVMTARAANSSKLGV
jgi:O-antigen/teichoic acid export membrane protein